MTSNELMHEKSTISKELLSEFPESVKKMALKKIESKQLSLTSSYKKKYKFTFLLEEVVPYKRPRANFRQKRIYDPPESGALKDTLEKRMREWCESMKKNNPSWCLISKNMPIRIVLNIYIAPPKGASKVDLYLMETGLIRPAVRPDVDNYAKNILDGIAVPIMTDDGQVVSYACDKFYSQQPRLEFVISTP